MTLHQNYIDQVPVNIELDVSRATSSGIDPETPERYEEFLVDAHTPLEVLASELKQSS